MANTALDIVKIILLITVFLAFLALYACIALFLLVIFLICSPFVLIINQAECFTEWLKRRIRWKRNSSQS